MARVIAIANQKGGVGKTTTAISLGAALHELGARVLLVDMDSQGTLSIALGVHSMKLTVYDVLCDVELGIEEILITTQTGCELAPSNIHLAGAEVELINEPGREFILKGKLASVDKAYDFILLDCPPSLGVLTLNAFTAAGALPRLPGHAADPQHDIQGEGKAQSRPRRHGNTAHLLRQADPALQRGGGATERALRGQGDQHTDPGDDQVRRYDDGGRVHSHLQQFLSRRQRLPQIGKRGAQWQSE